MRNIILLIIISVAVQSVASAGDLRIDTYVIAQMESSGNPFARNGEHYGLCQISRGVLKDYNKSKSTVWSVADLFNGAINLRIAEWYINVEIPRLLRYYGLKDTLENRLTAWRLGVRSVLSNKQAKKYVKRYEELKRGKK